MSDHDPKKTLSEISHLFLSSIRDKQTNGAPRPLRTPPGKSAPAQQPSAQQGSGQQGSGQQGSGQQGSAQPTPAQQTVFPPPQQAGGLPRREPGGPWSGMNIDLTPAELADVSPGPEEAALEAPGVTTRQPNVPRKSPPVTAVIAAHLNGRQFDRVKDYARHLAGQAGARVGLIELDASEFRLMCFEPGMAAEDAGGASAHSAEVYDPRQIAEAVEELNWDVDRWLLLLPTPRVPEARALLRQVDHWVLLTTCDHDGVVAGYRTLKGLVDTNQSPRVTLALLDGSGEEEMLAVYRKLSAVSHQFLGLKLEAEAPVRASYRIGEHLVLFCRPTRDKAQLANPPQWSIVSEFLGRARGSAPVTDEGGAGDAGGKVMPEDVTAEVAAEPQFVGNVTMPLPAAAAEPALFVSASTAPVQAQASTSPITPPTPATAPALSTATAPPAFDEVIELSDDSGTADAVLSAVLRQNNGSYVECPVRAPMCDGVRVAVGRDRGVVLFAVAREGLGELRSIGQALRWLSENRLLLGMALPQFAIDTHQAPRLRLLVDHSDLSADALQPVLQSDSVTVQSYRKLRWGGRTGLLLDAA